MIGSFVIPDDEIELISKFAYELMSYESVC